MSGGDHPLDFQRDLGEVQQQPMLLVHRLQVGSDNGKVNVFQVLDGLEFYDDGVIYEEVESMATDFRSIVGNDDFHLGLDDQASLFQLDDEGFLVDGFQEARPQAAMNLDWLHQ